MTIEQPNERTTLNRLITTLQQNFQLDGELLEHVTGAFSATEFRRGQHVLRAGTVCRHLTFIESGLVRHYYHASTDEVTRWISVEGAFVVSLGSFITQTPTVENIQALEKSTLYQLDKQAFDQFYRLNESLREGWRRQLEAYYVAMEQRLYESVAQTAEERYQQLAITHPTFLKRVPLRHVASLLNISPRHLSRIRRNAYELQS